LTADQVRGSTPIVQSASAGGQLRQHGGRLGLGLSQAIPPVEHIALPLAAGITTRSLQTELS
jgi:hypothetical protein